MSLCPEAEMRAAMDDGQFWAHVLGQPDGPDGYDPDEDPWAPEPEPIVEPCVECGQLGACAYDPEGRPLIHAINAEEDDR